MENIKAGRRYAGALFHLCVEEENVEETHGDLRFLRQFMESSPPFARYLHSPVVSVERKKEALSEVLGSHISKATLKFLEFLVDKKRTAVLPSVTARYEELMNEMMGLLRAKIVTAAPIDLEQRESLVNKLGILTKRKKVELEEAVDPSIIGGAIVSYDDRSIDGSLRTQLALLRERMKEVRVA